MPRRSCPIAEDIERVATRFKEWREEKNGRERIPAGLWSAAIALCRRHSVHRIASALRVNHTDLRKRVEVRRKPAPRRDRRASAVTFAELTVPPPAGAPDCLVEIEDSRGAKLRLEFRGSLPDLTLLGRVFWRRKG